MARKPKNKVTKFITTLLTWVGAALVYFAIFSLLFDTPAEYELRHSTDRMRAEYQALSARYDSLNMVVNNVIERDRNIFGILFESTPYDFNSDYEQQRVALHEKLLEQSKGRMLKDLSEQTELLEAKIAQLDNTYSTFQSKLDSLGSMSNNIPSIQPVINHQLTLLTAGYGMLMHPFYRALQSHQGIDYTIPEGESIFATADGVVKDVLGKTSTSGITVVIDHGNGYTTSYSHLQKAKVKRRQRVRRGDIIAISGNSGLSLSPHLHYEVRYEGMRVDPVHYFFMELTPDEYQKILRISQSGMQSFD
ncbi:MAG: M23 family metallopeptidase [Alistipes sp.]|nr:M23 family metallopeptidase [Rikenellaceae bacterium]MBQ8853752.1 M23 family metallopeptidase [Alistipes sp.]